MRLLFILTFCCLTLTACRDDFSLEAPFADIPNVAAYLNAADGNHFVRVQKAFIGGQDGNAELAAQQADSIYYGENAATVSLQIGENEPVILNRVNGEDFGFFREEGIFAESPNVLYQVSDSELNLSGGQRVTLNVERVGEEPATASTRMLGDISVNRPAEALIVSTYAQNQTFRWLTSNDARVYDLRLLMNIREFYPNDPDLNRTVQLVWQMAENYIPDTDETTVRFDFRNELFWQFLGANLEVDVDVRRVFDDMDFIVTAVGGELEDKLALEGANGGITSAQSLPIYTNITNGLGIFTSRSSALVEDILLDSRNRDTLLNGIYTRDLNFQ